MRIWQSLAPRLCALSAGLTALAAATAALYGTTPPGIQLALAATFAVAAFACSIPLRAFPAFGLVTSGLLVAAGVAYLLSQGLPDYVGIVLATIAVVSLAAAAWPSQPMMPRVSQAPPSSPS